MFLSYIYLNYLHISLIKRFKHENEFKRLKMYMGSQEPENRSQSESSETVMIPNSV